MFAHFKRALFLVAILVGSLITSDRAQAKFNVLYDFGGVQGSGPTGRLIADKAGNLFGTTTGGGAFGYGTVFKLSPDGQETVLYSFAGHADGSEPGSSLLEDKSGNLFGTTPFGGNKSCPAGSCGTVFKVTPDGTESVLYAFKGGSDGAIPSGGLVADKAGNIYGTTYNGGAYNNGGTAFKLQPNGTESVLHSFGNGTDGAGPLSSLTFDASGNLYGTTSYGGDSSYGTAFKLASNGTETVLYSFTGGADGSEAEGALIIDKDGILYGTTAGGGNVACGAFGCGVVFRLAPNATQSVLYAFAGGTDGSYPAADLALDSSGNLYGTTTAGGLNNKNCHERGCGTLFKLASDGTKTTLYVFTGKKDGGWPEGGLILSRKGRLFGSAYVGGEGGSGIIFEMMP